METMKRFSQAEHVLLLLLYSPGSGRSYNEPVDGKTRLMKLVFLLDKEARSDFPLRLVAYGYVEEKVIEFSSNRRLSVYRLSEKGLPVAKDYWAKLPPEAKRDTFSVKNQFNAMSMTKLLHYVYSSFPEYTGRSMIKK
ncbi:MAG: hypothetical protein ACE5IO_09875, partial [Thermoplasmata archaeon]